MVELSPALPWGCSFLLPFSAIPLPSSRLPFPQRPPLAAPELKAGREGGAARRICSVWSGPSLARAWHPGTTPQPTAGRCLACAKPSRIKLLWGSFSPWPCSESCPSGMGPESDTPSSAKTQSQKWGNETHVFSHRGSRLALGTSDEKPRPLNSAGEACKER